MCSFRKVICGKVDIIVGTKFGVTKHISWGARAGRNQLATVVGRCKGTYRREFERMIFSHPEQAEVPQQGESTTVFFCS